MIKNLINELNLYTFKTKTCRIYIDFNGTGKIFFTKNEIISASIFKNNKNSQRLLSNFLFPYKKFFENYKIDVIYKNKRFNTKGNEKLSLTFNDINIIIEDLNTMIQHLEDNNFFVLMDKSKTNALLQKVKQIRESGGFRDTDNMRTINQDQNITNDNTGGKRCLHLINTSIKVRLIVIK